MCDAEIIAVLRSELQRYMAPIEEEAINAAIKIIEERKTGKWVFLPTKDSLSFWFCSCCGWYNNYSKREFKYCPNCGAKMEVDE